MSWTAGLALLGALIGSVATSVGDMARESTQLKDVLESGWGGAKGLSDAYIASAMVIFALAAAGYAIQATLRLRAEEESGCAELVLATAASRLRWAASHLLFGLLPRLAPVSWAALAVAAFLVLFGPLLRLSQGIIDLAPFSHIPKVPGAAVSAAPLLWLLVIAAVLAAAGLAGFRGRDLVSTA